MSLDVFWRLPPDGDGRSHRRADWIRGEHQGVPQRPFAVARTDGRDPRFTYYDHLAQVARAAELAGFDGVVRVSASKESAPFNWFSDHQILNVEVDFNADDAGTLAIEVDPTHWLDFLDFASLPDRGDGVRTFTDAQQTSLRAGVTSRAAFRFSWKGQNP